MAFRRTSDTGESATERATADIRQRIRNGELVPGQRLVAAELSTTMDVSLGPVREALTRLAGEGLVEMQAFRGAVVRRQSAEDLAEIYLVREVVEGLAARLAAQAVATGERSAKTLQRTAARGAKLAASFDLDGYLAANQDFHEAIYALAGMPRVTTLARTFSDQVDRLNNRHLASKAVLKKSADEHQAIVEAIAAGDAARAEMLMRAHVASMGTKVRGLS